MKKPRPPKKGAWNALRLAAFHVSTTSIIINRGEPSVGHVGVTEIAAGFHADVPDLRLVCDGVRGAGSHVIYLWTFTGHHAETGHPLNVSGWEEWELDENGKVTSSLGWFDGEEYDRQVAG